MKMSLENPSRLTVDLALVSVAVVWGSGYTLSSIALTGGFPVSLVLSVRFLVGASVMFILFGKNMIGADKKDIKYGLLIGLLLFTAFLLETTGLSLTTPSKNAFLNCSSVLMVPFVYWVLTKKRPPVYTFMSVVICFAGISILSYTPDMGFYLNAGDLISLCSASLYATHICAIGAALKKCKNSLVISILQLAVVGVLGSILFIFKDMRSFDPAALKVGLLPCVVMGVFSTAFCYGMQTWAQKHASPTEASVILSLELVSGGAFSVIFGLDRLTPNLFWGGIVIFTAIVFSQICSSKMAEKENKKLKSQA